MYSIHAMCDYIVARCAESGTHIDMLKLQKLLYYCQAWNLAYGRGRLFNETFQAWIHGPVSRTIYDRFAKKAMYSPITINDLSGQAFTIKPEDEQLICSVLSTYAQFTGDQLEYLTHTEAPWLEARQGLNPDQRSENIISDEIMEKFYRQRLVNTLSSNTQS